MYGIFVLRMYRIPPILPPPKGCLARKALDADSIAKRNDAGYYRRKLPEKFSTVSYRCPDKLAKPVNQTLVAPDSVTDFNAALRLHFATIQHS